MVAEHLRGVAGDWRFWCVLLLCNVQRHRRRTGRKMDEHYFDGCFRIRVRG